MKGGDAGVCIVESGQKGRREDEGKQVTHTHTHTHTHAHAHTHAHTHAHAHTHTHIHTCSMQQNNPNEHCPVRTVKLLAVI